MAWADVLPAPPYRFREGDTFGRRIPTVAVYDGFGVTVGRVVTDSTWHHWANVNLKDLFSDEGSLNAQMIRRYYANISLWLAPPSVRANVVRFIAKVLPYTTYGLQTLHRSMSPGDFGFHCQLFLSSLVGSSTAAELLKDYVMAIGTRASDGVLEEGKPVEAVTGKQHPQMAVSVVGQLARKLFLAAEHAGDLAAASAPRTIKYDELIRELETGFKASLGDRPSS